MWPFGKKSKPKKKKIEKSRQKRGGSIRISTLDGEIYISQVDGLDNSQINIAGGSITQTNYFVPYDDEEAEG